ncbi:hypothetical protein NC653_034793 [Populus alba x Populus x berolinensis]|uniref:Methyltransferase n=1 Tax=Populus alba x Populus x berolinensis TaxID=444605 RepID=A0AAD6LNB9_9ROSI|nr:hypothetical protein NC653_034793 [Populus alba x Populus x berolinensis]
MDNGIVRTALDTGCGMKSLGAARQPFSERLNAVPSRISSGSIPGVSVEALLEDNRRINKTIDSGRYRSFMDMNAGMGGFAAALESAKTLWVLNMSVD